MQKILSNYIEAIPYNNGVVLFNKLNGNIVYLDKEHVSQTGETTTIDCSDEEIDALDSYGFFIDDSVVRDCIRKKCSHQSILKKTSVVLSVTEKCNLSCKYCYQSVWEKDEPLSDEDYTSMVLGYLKEIIPQINDIEGILDISFIGGEPLLKSELITLIVQEILAYVAKKHYDKIEIKFNIDSNGLFLTRDFIKKFPNLTVTTTLSLSDDHNNLRSGSFDQLFNTLSQLSDVFDGSAYRLFIRYNMHHGNFDDLDKFITMLESIDVRYSLDVQNIMNTPKVAFTNKLDDTNFDKIYLSKILPCLLKHNLIPAIIPNFGLSRHCSCANILSRKFYSNGQIVLCDAVPKSNRELPLGEMPTLPEACVCCYDFPYCGGPKPCDTSECTGTYRKKATARNRIIAYVKYSGILDDN